jgi:hypothetical protein
MTTLPNHPNTTRPRCPETYEAGVLVPPKDYASVIEELLVTCTCSAKDMPFGRCCKSPKDAA